MRNVPGICTVCGSGDLRLLPVPARQSMLSDGRVANLALRRHACADCGLAAHVDPPSAEATRAMFAGGYDLYAHPAGDPFEGERQRHYAGWIHGLAGPVSRERVLDIGCGNGSLLMALRALWPAASFAGIEPVEAAAVHARQAGFAISRGFLEPGTVARNAADIVIAVNVAEHASDPLLFLRSFRDCLAPSGRGILICPDGDTPSVELLVFDHLHSFTAAALARVCAAAGLGILRHSKSPAGLPGFQAAVVERSGGGSQEPAIDPGSALRLVEARRAFLLAWQRLDDRLQERAAGAPELVCFGTGECARLLRAYAPGLWRKIAAFTIDGGTGSFDGRPVTDYASLKPAAGRAVLPAVRHEAQGAICQRLRDDGHAVLAWDDLLPA